MQPVPSILSGISGSPFKVAGPMAIPGVISPGVNDERRLQLARAPAYVVRQDCDGGKVRYALVLGQALGRRALMDLLYAVAPYKAHGPDRFARVLDNWRLHDRAATNGGSQSLFLQHSTSLRSSWQVFAEHREFYIAIFEDETESTRVVPLITWEKGPDGARRWLFEAIDPALARVLAESVPFLREPGSPGRVQLDALAGLVSIPYLLPELRKHWPAWQPLVKNGKSNYIGPASVPVVAHMHRRAIMNSALIRAVEALDATG